MRSARAFSSCCFNRTSQSSSGCWAASFKLVRLHYQKQERIKINKFVNTNLILNFCSQVIELIERNLLHARIGGLVFIMFSEIQDLITKQENVVLNQLGLKGLAFYSNNDELPKLLLKQRPVKWMLHILQHPEKRSPTGLVLHNSKVKTLFVDGGFSNNSIYTNLLAIAFPGVEVYAASISQASALGAALAIHHSWNKKPVPSNLIGLKQHSPIL